MMGASSAKILPEGERFCLPELFAIQAKKSPEARALVYEDVSLTFAELNGRSNQLAHFLRRHGVGPEKFVGIYLERSWEMVLALLGILKAGGAYVSLDPHAPAERVGFMMADTGMAVVLTQATLAEKLPDNGTMAVSLDTEWPRIAAESAANLPQLALPENAAYALFTSGSTGTPKGVVVEHRQLLNYLFSIRERLQIPEEIQFATVSTFAADLGNTAVFPPLCFGGTLHVISEERIANPDAFATYFRQHQIDFLKIVPSHLNALLNAARPADVLPRLRLVLGGEASSWELIETLLALKTDTCQIYNHYGPTETTIGVLTYPVQEPLERPSAALPLGQPIWHTQATIVDEALRSVPDGEVGELLIGGQNVSRGYLNRPDLTAEKFLSDPFSQTPGVRFYRTGDQVRRLPSGDIEFLGRIDDQVKIRGFRVELGEVQACLNAHPRVREAVVLAREDNPGIKRLVAYIVAHAKAAPTAAALRSHVLATLPDYMAPAAFVFLESLPLNANGKINRQVLPLPEQTRPQLNTPFVAPVTPAETRLAQIFADVLRVDRVGIHDNFFDLGGDSILNIQIVARAGQAGLYFTPQQLFQHQTIAELAETVAEAPVILAEQGPVTGEVPLTPALHWLLELNPAELNYWNMYQLLTVRQPLDVARLAEALTTLLGHHDALRLRLQSREADSSWQAWQALPGEKVSLLRYDLRDKTAQEQSRLVTETAVSLHAQHNLTAGPIVQVAYFDCSPIQPDRLFISIHHIGIDGISWRILLEDLQTAYWQQPLPRKTSPFQQWATRLAQHVQDGGAAEEQSFWLNLAETAVPPLPLDYPDGLAQNKVGSTAIVSVSLTTEETQALLQAVPPVYNTQINDVLLAALAQTMVGWTGSPRLLLDLEGHGREQILDSLDISRTVGWFTAIFPVLLNMSSVVDIRTALMTVKEQLRQIPHKGIGFGLLRYLAGETAVSRQLKTINPPISFNYLGRFDNVSTETTLFWPAPETAEPRRSPAGKRRYLLEISGIVTEGKMRFDWIYGRQLHAPATIQNLANSFVANLREIITHCQNPDVGGFTPSDFPELAMDQGELDNLLDELGDLLFD